MDCILKSFTDTVTWMIVDIVGVLAHESGEAQSWQKITVKELRPSSSSPRRRLIITTDREKDGCVCWLCVKYPTCICIFYIELMNWSSDQPCFIQKEWMLLVI